MDTLTPVVTTETLCARRAACFVTATLVCALATPGFAAVIIVPDDQPTIQAAVTAAMPGDTVQVRPGVYAESVRIGTAQTGLTVEGLGGRPIITPPAGSNGIFIDKVNTVTIRNLEIQGGGRAVRLHTSTGSTLTDLVVSGQTRVSMLVRNGSSNTVSDNSVTGAAVDGIRVERSDAAVVTGNVVSNSGRRGLQVKSGETATVTDNSVDTSGGDGVQVLRMKTGAVITGNTSTTSGRTGINVKTVNNATISGNGATGAAREGVSILKIVGGTFDGNVGDANTLSGIRVKRCGNVTVTTNQANGNGAYGFWVQATPPIATPADLIAAGNTASGNTLDDFRVDP